MAVPTTLLQYATARRQRIADDRNRTQTELRRVQTDLSAERQSVQARGTQIAQFEARAEAIRSSLAAAPTSADGAALLAELELVTIRLRAAQAEQLDAQLRVAAFESAQTRLGAKQTASSSVLEAARDEEERARQRATRLQREGQLVAQPPLAGLRAAATAELAGAVAAAAQARVAADIPAALLTRARERYAQATARLAARSSTLQATEDSGTGKAAGAVRRAEAALTGYVAQARAQLDAARASLVRIADPRTPGLTAAQRARINEAALVAAGTAAAAKEKDVDDARAALDGKQADLDQAIIAARLADIEADPSTNAAVIAAKSARDAAKTTLDTAANAYTASMRESLSRWEAAVPATTWQLAGDLAEATRSLTRLSSLDAATLPAAVATAETAWAAELAAADLESLTAEFLEDEVAARAAALEAESQVNHHRRLIALRGDIQGA